MISIHALREEGDKNPLILSPTPDQFLSTPSARRATSPFSPTPTRSENFYPRPPRGGRPGLHDTDIRLNDDFYPRPPRGGRPRAAGCCSSACTISIHALREEGDRPLTCRRTRTSNFYPRPPRGGRLLAALGYEMADDISIHALREEGDQDIPLVPLIDDNFYPRPPRGGRPFGVDRMTAMFCNFYPRPPRGGRLSAIGVSGAVALFLSTPSARRATRASGRCCSRPGYFYPRPPRGGRRVLLELGLDVGEISIHALREEGDRRPSRRPRRFQTISIHALREEGDLPPQAVQREGRDISIHALREEGDAVLTRCMRPSMNFYPRPPRGGRQSYRISSQRSS